MSRRLGLVGWYLLLTTLFAAALRADTIVLTDGTQKTDVQVVNETYKGVVYRLRGISADQSYPAERVKEVIYGRMPQEYREGINFMKDGDYPQAYDAFMEVVGSARKADEHAQQYAYFYAAECRRLAGDLEDAIKTYTDLLNNLPETAFYGEASLRKADCYRDLKKDDQAMRVLVKLKQDVEEKGLGSGLKYAAELAIVQIDPNMRAADKLQKLIELQERTAKDFPGVANRARLAIGAVYIQQRQFDKARSFFQEIVDKRIGSPEEVVAGAYNGLGEALMSSSERADDQKTALLHFLRVIYHYPNVRTEHAKAMYWAGKIFKIQGEKGRSRNLLNRCVSEFPGTRWAELAKAEM
ncbi:MAG: tetratricopeptide repeat protein [Planctomycetota bacterium]